MLLSTQTEYPAKIFGDEEAVRLLADVGFDAADYSFFDMGKKDDPFHGDGWLEHAKAIRKAADKYGIVFNQAHATMSFEGWEHPFVSWLDEDSYTKCVFPVLHRTLDICSVLGAKTVIVHPLHYRPFGFDKKACKEANVRFYRALIPYCKKTGVRVAVENMWDWDSVHHCMMDDTCCHADEFCDYLDTIGSEWVVGCLDIGHCTLVGDEPQATIRAMGGDHIQALHVHDNDYLQDTHTAPYNGKMNWDEITKALGEINYGGDFTYEADSFMANIDSGLIRTAEKYLHDVGRFLIEKIKASQKQ